MSEPENHVNPHPDATLITCSTGCRGPCDFTGWVDLVEPTTGRVTGGSQVCKTCGRLAIDHSMRWYGDE